MHPYASIQTTYLKTLTCKQSGGACDKAFHANGFEAMASLSKKIWYGNVSER